MFWLTVSSFLLILPLMAEQLRYFHLCLRCLAFKLFRLIGTKYSYTNYILGGRQGKASRNQASADWGTKYFWLIQLHAYFWYNRYETWIFLFSSTWLTLMLFWFIILVFVTNRKQNQQLLKQEQNLSWEVYASKLDNLFFSFYLIFFSGGGICFSDAGTFLISLKNSSWSLFEEYMHSFLTTR